MQQVDSFFKIKYFLIGVFSVFILTGCSSKTSQAVFSTKVYDTNEVSKDQLLDAVKKVFILSDKKNFIIHSYRDKVEVSRTKLSFMTIDPTSQSDHFEFKIEKQEEEKLITNIAISREDTLEENSKFYLDPSNISYQIFWDRVDFLLGLKKQWAGCQYIVEETFFCDIVDLDNNTGEYSDRIKKEEYETKQLHNIRTIDLSDVLYKNRKNTTNNDPSIQVVTETMIKEEKKGIEEKSLPVKSFNLKDIGVEDRKPSKQTKSLDEEVTKEEK